MPDIGIKCDTENSSELHTCNLLFDYRASEQSVCEEEAFCPSWSQSAAGVYHHYPRGGAQPSHLPGARGGHTLQVSVP